VFLWDETLSDLAGGHIEMFLYGTSIHLLDYTSNETNKLLNYYHCSIFSISTSQELTLPSIVKCLYCHIYVLNSFSYFPLKSCIPTTGISDKHVTLCHENGALVHIVASYPVFHWYMSQRYHQRLFTDQVKAYIEHTSDLSVGKQHHLVHWMAKCKSW